MESSEQSFRFSFKQLHNAVMFIQEKSKAIYIFKYAIDTVMLHFVKLIHAVTIGSAMNSHEQDAWATLDINCFHEVWIIIELYHYKKISVDLYF